MAFRFEFDRANRILLAGFEGRVTEGLVAECYRATRKYSTATDARAQILDFSYTTEFALSPDFLQTLARKPASPDGLMRPCFIVAPTCVWIRSSSRVSDGGRAYAAITGSRTYHRRGVSSTRRSIHTLRAFRVTSRVAGVAQKTVPSSELAHTPGIARRKQTVEEQRRIGG